MKKAIVSMCCGKCISYLVETNMKYRKYISYLVETKYETYSSLYLP
jgi:hypothetical protein